MTKYLVRMVSSFEEYVVVEAENKEDAAVKAVNVDDFLQKHLGNEVYSVTEAEEDWAERIREKGFW